MRAYAPIHGVPLSCIYMNSGSMKNSLGCLFIHLSTLSSFCHSLRRVFGTEGDKRYLFFPLSVHLENLACQEAILSKMQPNMWLIKLLIRGTSIS